jgi:hypothetical protein
MEDVATFPGTRLVLAPDSPRPVAVWTGSRSESLFSAWLDAGKGPIRSRAIEQSRSRAFTEPAIQALSREIVAIAWTDNSGPRPRVRLTAQGLDGSGRRWGFSSDPGKDDVDLSLTPQGDLVLASTLTTDQGSSLVVQLFSRQGLRPLGRLEIRGDNPSDPQLAKLSAGGADMAVLYRDDRGISLSTLNLAAGRQIDTLRLSGQAGSIGPALTSDGSRTLVAAWSERNPATGEDVRQQTIDAVTGARSPIHQPHADGAGDQRDPMVALSSRGWIRTSWRDNNSSSTRISSGLSRLDEDGQWQRGDQFSTDAGVPSKDPDVITLRNGSAILGWTEGQNNNQRVRLAAFADQRFGGSGGAGGPGEPVDPGRPGEGRGNRIVATLARDGLTGTAAADVFVFPTRSHSLLGHYDTIQRYQPNDVIDDHHARRNVTVDPITGSAGTIRSLTPSELNKVCRQRFGYGVFGAVAFEVRGEPGTWLAINDRREGFQANSDPIIHLADYRLSQASPIMIL